MFVACWDCQSSGIMHVISGMQASRKHGMRRGEGQAGELETDPHQCGSDFQIVGRGSSWREAKRPADAPKEHEGSFEVASYGCRSLSDDDPPGVGH